MKKQFLFSLLLVAAPLLLMATTHTGDVTLASQAQVDNFKITTGNADTINGFISIQGADIMNLDSLHNLQRVGGNLLIQSNNSLANIDGLHNLQSVSGGLYIMNNSSIANIDSLHNLQSIGGAFYIQNNSSLANIDGLHNLQSIGAELLIINNSSLANIDGLQNLQSTGGTLRITSNPMLNACCGVFPVISTVSSIAIGSNASGCNTGGEIVNGGACARILPPPPAPIPTMGQWGLFVFGLIIFTLGVVVVWNVSMIRGMTQDK